MYSNGIFDYFSMWYIMPKAQCRTSKNLVKYVVEWCCFFLSESYFWPLISGIFMFIFFRIRLYQLQPTRIILIRVRMIFILLQKSVQIYVLFFTLLCQSTYLRFFCYHHSLRGALSAFLSNLDIIIVANAF